MTFKILNTIGEGYAPEGKKILESVGEVTYAPLSQEQLKDEIALYDAVVIGLGLNFDKEVLEKADRLNYIATATTGLDHIDLKAAQKKGIKVVSLRGENDFLNTITGTAELAFCLILELARNTHAAFDAVKRYEWNRNVFQGESLYGKTLGIVGLGRLGKMVARFGLSFGMHVIFTDPEVREFPHATNVPLETLLAQSDVVSIHVHLLPATQNMFDKKALSKMKQGAYLVNTSRGKIVDEEAVLSALNEGIIGGYATDVLSDELQFETKGFKNHPLVEYAKSHQNLIIVPHIGGMTRDSREATDIFIAEKLKRAIDQQGSPSVV